MHKYVYSFSQNHIDGKGDMRNLLGGKGANLAEMCAIKLPVPPGFTITTEVCNDYYAHGKAYNDEVQQQIDAAITHLERESGKQFGSSQNPLLVSVRSGARASMPGMMDTVLNLGLNDVTVKALQDVTGDARFAFDSYRRFIQMYSNVVLGMDHHVFEDVLEAAKRRRNVDSDTGLLPEDLELLVKDYRRVVKEEIGHDFPQDVHEQLKGAIKAVFDSWMTNRAKTYRKLHDIPASWGTAVNVQAMVFGNMGDDCATGVAFTRDPSTGDNIFYGEYLINAQGEDVVAGIRTPQQLTQAMREVRQETTPSLEEAMPDVFKQLSDIRHILENHYGDMQDIEFTVESSKLYMLQTRAGKRTMAASLKIACDMVAENIIDKDTALLRVNPQMLDQILHPVLDPQAVKEIIAIGLPASPGAASGQVTFSADKAEELAEQGRKVMLCRIETSPEDIHGMHAAQGIITTRGGMTSHAAVVARGMGRACVSGVGSIVINMEKGYFTAGAVTVNEGDWVTIDGSKGEVIKGDIDTVQPELGGHFSTIMSWADERRVMNVRTNADTPDDCRTARKFGAEGIGLCRTEHMFFDQDRIIAMREMILANQDEERQHALDKLLPMQRQDFEDIFTIMAGTPVTVRLLDPPLHEFLPKEDSEFDALAATMKLNTHHVRQRAHELQESNPMLGHRGCRLLNSYPAICAMQARAIFEAAAQVYKKTNAHVACEIMVPLVSIENELKMLKSVIVAEAEAVCAETGIELQYSIGTMIELPRAAIIAEDIAKDADFFSFGTNDLTQTTFGFSRDDIGGFIHNYQQKNIITFDPFQTLDIDGVGQLIIMARDNGRKSNPTIKLGICGEHGGDPASVNFCHNIGLDYVSCSPFRVPIARLTAAQAAIKQEQGVA